MLVLSNQLVSVRVSLDSPRTAVQDSLFINPVLERFCLVSGHETAFPLHDSHVELQSSKGCNIPARCDKGVQGFADCAVLSPGPEVIDLASERGAFGAPVDDRKRLVELVGGFLPSAPSGQVETVLLLVCDTPRVLKDFLVPIFDTLVPTINGGTRIGENETYIVKPGLSKLSEFFGGHDGSHGLCGGDGGLCSGDDGLCSGGVGLCGGGDGLFNGGEGDRLRFLTSQEFLGDAGV